jgi:hypothetical protein
MLILLGNNLMTVISWVSFGTERTIQHSIRTAVATASDIFATLEA